MYGGRIRPVNRWRSPSSSTRRSFTRGARTFIVPAPQVTFRDCARPLRTTRRRPSASRAAVCVSMYCSTSASKTAISLRRPLSRANSSRVGTAPSDVSRLSSLVGSSTPSIGVVYPSPPACPPGWFLLFPWKVTPPVSRPDPQHPGMPQCHSADGWNTHDKSATYRQSMAKRGPAPPRNGQPAARPGFRPRRGRPAARLLAGCRTAGEPAPHGSRGRPIEPPRLGRGPRSARPRRRAATV